LGRLASFCIRNALFDVRVRVIAGEFRGRKLLPPATGATRPITDRAKQSLFDILAPVIPGATVYDCFAGTGSMGLESLSRGCERVTFFESNRSALDRLRKNIAELGVESRSTVIPTNLFRWFATQSTGGKASLVFLDPPYRYLDERVDDLRKLSESLASRHLSPGAIVVFRHDSNDSLELPCLIRFDQREYGGMTIELLSQDTAPRIG
jgi:16S rRNA (guanine966-N2)-methyltransferase